VSVENRKRKKKQEDGGEKRKKCEIFTNISQNQHLATALYCFVNSNVLCGA
jgi:hypothetical protein